MTTAEPRSPVPGRTPRWTHAHTEAARFVGECLGAGAVLGMVAALRRPRAGE